MHLFNDAGAADGGFLIYPNYNSTGAAYEK